MRKENEHAGGGPEAFTKNTIFDVLRNSRRRMVLRYLLRESEPVQMGDLAEHVARLEHDAGYGPVSSKQRKRVYVALYQSHLPRMRDAELVTYDESKVVALSDAAAAIEPFLEWMTEPGPVPTDGFGTSPVAEGVSGFERLLPAHVVRALREQGIDDPEGAELRRAVLTLVAERPDELVDHVLRRRGEGSVRRD